MNSQRSKSKFMTGLNYLNHMQCYGKENGNRLMINRRFENSKTLYSKDLFAHYGCVNAIEFSNDGEWLVSGGDDKRVLLWNVDKNLLGLDHPKSMKGEHNSNIFCLGFSNSHSKLFSAGNDEQVILHDVATGETVDVYLHSEAVYGLSVDPVNENIFATACDNGSLLVWDIRLASNEPFTLSKRLSSYHAVMYNPVEPRYLATANAHDGVCLWDIRQPKVHLLKYSPNVLFQSAMSVRFNAMGTHLLALRRRFPPVLYDIASVHPVAEFDHQEYYNSCTMKSCSFAGDKDQFVVSGSDDFKLYVWKIPDLVDGNRGIWVTKAHFVLRGHRSIVNQVRYNDTYSILASSGVEKIVKLWSSFPLVYREDYSQYISSKDHLRKVYSPTEFDDIFRDTGHFMSHDYSHHSVQEDYRMLAFFDHLVQRDIETWNDPKTKDKFAVFQSVESLSSSDDSSTDDENSSSPSDDDYKDVSAIHSDRAPRKLSTSLSYMTKRALANNQADDMLKTSEHLDPALDRIAILIAGKRRDEMLKAIKSVQQNGQTMNSTLTLDEGAGTSKKDDTACVIFSSKDTRSKTEEKFDKYDKRRYWTKKRAELDRESVLVPDAASSGDTELEPMPKSDSKYVNDSVSHSAVVSDAVCDTITNNATSSKKSSIDDEMCKESNCSTNNMNGMGSSNQAADSSNTTFFVKGGKRVKRNYRKRSSDEENE